MGQSRLGVMSWGQDIHICVFGLLACTCASCCKLPKRARFLLQKSPQQTRLFFKRDLALEGAYDSLPKTLIWSPPLPPPFTCDQVKKKIFPFSFFSWVAFQARTFWENTRQCVIFCVIYIFWACWIWHAIHVWPLLERSEMLRIYSMFHRAILLQWK